MKVNLVIMAAGLGSRYQGGIKQLETIGPHGEILMDYSILDAKKAGFDKVIFIIRHAIEKDFKEIIGNRIEKIIPCEYAYQEISDIPSGYEVGHRMKPWGTGHAIMAAAPFIDGPFAVINADDYYGPKSFQKMYDYLIQSHASNEYAIIGYSLFQTLSESGGVTRGVCKLNELDELISIKESYQVRREGNQIISDNNFDIKETDIVSMNFFGFQPSILKELKNQFSEFLNSLEEADLKSEFLIPEIVSKLIKEKKATVKVLKTDDKWVGLTYREDKKLVKKEIEKLYEKKIEKNQNI